MSKIAIRVHRGFFVATPADPAAVRACEKAYQYFTTSVWVYDPRARRKVKKKGDVYASYVQRDNAYHFTIQYLVSFVNTLAAIGVKRDNIETSIRNDYKTEPIDITVGREWVPRAEQKPYIKALTETKNYASLVNFQTGGGKGFISIKAVVTIGDKVGVFVLPKYMEKWKLEFLEKTDIDEKDICEIKGFPSLARAMRAVEEGKIAPKVVIFSNRTMVLFAKKYERDTVDDDASFEPGDVLDAFGIGTVLVDEAHQEFYSVFKNSLHYDAYRNIALSATFKNDNHNINTYQKFMYPEGTRYAFSRYKRYVNVIPTSYMIREPRRVHCITANGYSHIEFEQSIMARPVMLKRYLDMIIKILKKGYVDRKKNKDTALVFAATIDMCTFIARHIRTNIKSISVSRYVEDDPFDNLMMGDVVVSTVLSAGTAIDKKGLITVINTVSIKSSTSNEQSLGRLRLILGKDLRYYYIYAINIDKHHEYHIARMSQFESKAKRIIHESYDRSI